MVTAIESVTVGVGDLARALELFQGIMGLRLEQRFDTDALAAAWHLTPGTRVAVAELSCEGHPFGRLRLAQYQPAASTRVRVHSGLGCHDGPADVGPKAIDFYVADPILPLYQRIVSAGYAARSAPIRHEVGDTVSEEFVFWGPDGVPLLLMVGHRHSAEQLRGVLSPQGFSEVATVSVVGGDVERTRRFYGDVLGLSGLVDTETAPEFLDLACELTGVPRGTRIHWLLYAAPGEPSGKILVVHFDGAGGTRLAGRMRPGRLGFSLMTHATDDLDALCARVREAGFAVFQAPVRVRWADGERRIMLVRGPNEEMFEFREAGVR